MAKWGEVYGFDWDAANTKKCEKHGVSIAEIEFLFMHDPYLRLDVKHSAAERRYCTFGTNSSGRYIVVVFTYRERDGSVFIRPISARYMHIKEINRFKSYEKET